MFKLLVNDSRFRYEIIHHLIISLIMLVFPLLGGLLTPIQFVKFVFIFFSSGLIGKFINNFIGITNLFSLTQAALNIFIGLFLISVTYFFTGNFLPIYATTSCMLLLSIFIAFKEKEAIYRKLPTWYYLPIVVLFFIGYDYTYSTSLRLSQTDGDFFYYTLLVESFSRNCNLQNPFFHVAAPINYYQFTTFIIPSYLKAVTGLASSVVLWGIFMKLLIFLSIGIVCNLIINIIEEQTNSRIHNIYFTLSMTFFIFLGPLHLFNLIKLKLEDILFLGEGHWVPLGSPGFPFAIVFSCILILFLINSHQTKYKTVKLMIIFILSFIIFTSKIAFSLPFILFLTLFLFFHVEVKVFLTIAITFFIAFLLSQIIALQPDSIKHVSIVNHGYYYKRILDFAHKYQLVNASNQIYYVLGGLIIHVVLWVGIKIILMLPILEQVKFRVYSGLFKSWLIVFIVFISVAFFVHMESEGNSFFPIVIESFDFAATVRSSIIIFQSIFILFIITRLLKLPKKYKMAFICFLFGWCSLCFFSLISNEITNKISVNNKWYEEVASEINLIPRTNKLFAMQGDKYCSGQTLAPTLTVNWYCTGWRSDGEGYVWSRIVLKRNTLLKRLFSAEESQNAKRHILLNLKNNNVKYLVGTINNVRQLNELKTAGLLSSGKSKHKWLFEIL